MFKKILKSTAILLRLPSLDPFSSTVHEYVELIVKQFTVNFWILSFLLELNSILVCKIVFDYGAWHFYAAI